MSVKRIYRIGLIGLVLTAAVVGSRYRPVVVSGSSMLPTLHSGQVMFMERHSSNWGDVKRGEIVIFRRNGETCVKRVFAVQGDTVSLLTFANGATGILGDGAFQARRIMRFARKNPKAVRFARVVVPRGTVFVVGDNRNCSIDSRDFGPVPLGSILGRAVSARDALASLPHRLLPVAHVRYGAPTAPASLVNL